MNIDIWSRTLKEDLAVGVPYIGVRIGIGDIDSVTRLGEFVGVQSDGSLVFEQATFGKHTYSLHFYEEETE